MNMQNFRECGDLIGQDFPEKIIDNKRIKYIPMAEIPFELYNFSYPTDENFDARIVYIADSSNHCIRRLKIMETEVDTFAGICGKPGFVDGPFGTNQLNTPELVGVDALGYVFIYDAGNKYIRMVDPATGSMSTLI